MGINLKSLIGKLNDTTRGALEGAAGLCLSRTHYDIEIEHYLMKLLDQTDGDCAAILKHYGIDRSRLASELTRSLDRLKSGNARMLVHPYQENNPNMDVTGFYARESWLKSNRDARKGYLSNRQ